ncbi:hypothetical protein [Conexibacter woesei]|uniref:Protein SirB1 N-terminal domain-containing protein n=1 Tax=Conexibacter woesei (strain DSM 14684 / CCUG 47730 / CIP 108061 / JCM 11494 / NBRC 100937 / ID131577) TaxID=469383 RepID=D3F1Y5_CONWI|nr:hypothetical protein [Conexibacter woesei]ADB54166.1 hypothetical protein Cwoe_5765 [Conexibacter woesei DSM 14684]
MADGPVPFQALTSSDDVEHGVLAISLGAEFEPVDAASLDAALAPLVAELVPIARADTAEQLLAAEAILSRHLRAEPQGYRDLGIDDLLPHEVAAVGRGHELAVTLVALEAARRAGLRLGLVASVDAVYIAHPQLEAPVLLNADGDGPWRLVDTRELEDEELAWQSAHEAALLLLGLIVERTHETGLLTYELRAAELSLQLPVDDEEEERLRTQLDAVRARLN